MFIPLYNTSVSHDHENCVADDDISVEDAESNLILKCILKMEAIN